MHAVLVLVVSGVGLRCWLEHDEELEGIAARRLKETGKGIGVGSDELTDLFGREAAMEWATRGITEVEID